MFSFYFFFFFFGVSHDIDNLRLLKLPLAEKCWATVVLPLALQPQTPINRNTRGDDAI
jgi:hypothetical protein